MLLLGSRDESGILAEWRELRAQEGEGLQERLDARESTHLKAMRWLRSRAQASEASGSILTAAGLREGEREYDRETLVARRMLRRFRRMLRARRD